MTPPPPMHVRVIKIGVHGRGLKEPLVGLKGPFVGLNRPFSRQNRNISSKHKDILGRKRVLGPF